MTEDVFEHDPELAEHQERAAVNARRVREEDFARDGQETADVVGHWFLAAERATGLSREELLAQASAIPPPEPIVDPTPKGRRLARLWMEAAGAPELHIRNVCDRDPLECDALVAVRAFLDDPDLGLLVLAGGLGTRKSGSACWALSQQQGGVYLQADKLLRIAFDEKPRFQRIEAARLVVLDDLGTEGPDDKGYWHREFNSLFNGWYSACAKVVVTCNLTKQQFKQPPDKGGYGERVVDRIRERGRWITLAGESVRGHEQQSLPALSPKGDPR